MEFVADDGGRSAAGFKGEAGDCVCRSIAIAAGKPYREVYDLLNDMSKAERVTKNRPTRSSARSGVHRDTIRKLMREWGWSWTPTMHIGSGCTVHLRDGELPPGRLLVSLSGHFTAVIDGVIHDTYDPSRRGSRCVYGYYSKEA